jgi:translation initiation factor IF-1
VSPANRNSDEEAGGVAMSLRMEGMDIFEGDVISRELSEYHEKNGG